MESTTQTPRLGVVFGYSGDFASTANEAGEYERIGVDLLTVAEAYSFDAVSQLGYLAAKTQTITLASGILPIYSRTPALLAMTAAGLDFVSDGRFELGLGSSGAQVIEGFHGVPFNAPLGRIRENVEICRTIWRREPLSYQGKYYQAPLGAEQGRGLGKPLKLVNHPVRPSIPISIAALTPKSVTQAAEIADGWVPIFFYPEKANDAWGSALAEGSRLRSTALKPLDIVAQMPFYIGDDVDEALNTYRETVALYVGGMGARKANFYNDLAVTYGFGDEAALVQDLYLTGKKAEAINALPEDLVKHTSLIGSESEVREQVAALRRCGATTISVSAFAKTPAARIEQLEALRSMLR
jgi:F420-dependent oxidoreductase-like protein